MEKEEFEVVTKKLNECFSNAIYNYEKNKFVIRKNGYQNIVEISLKQEDDINFIKIRMLEWFSYPALYYNEYIQEWRNKKVRNMLLNGINKFLGTNFNKEQMEKIYINYGGAKNRTMCMQFILQNYNFDLMEK